MFQVRGVLKLQDVMMGKTEVASDLLNYFVVLVKLYIWKSRKNATRPRLGLLKEILKVKFRTEKYRAFKNNTMSKF